MLIGIISIFPDMFKAITNYGITSSAIKKGLLNIQFWSPRDFTDKKCKHVDDRPYGGGSGMLMMVQPLRNAINEAKKKLGKDTKVIYLSPQGRKLDHKGVNNLIENSNMILVCGRYKGIDERLIYKEIDEEWSIGDYVISGGELAAMILIDVVARFIPGVLNNKNSLIDDSFSKGLLDCPHYTHPKLLDGIEVPSVLLSGNHIDISRWRLKHSLGRTWLRRPELLEKVSLNEEEKILLLEFKYEYASLKKDKNKNYYFS